MSEGIKRMLAERDRATQVHEAARRRATLEPHRRAYEFGFSLVRRYLAGTLKGDRTDALAEGMVVGMMDGFIKTPAEGWTHSDSRRALLTRLDAEQEAQ